MSTIEALTAREILDSRGRPTIYATCRLRSGAVASVSVPSGASTGQAESCELRDGDPKRYRGLGCRKAVASVNGEISGAMAGRSFENQAAFDEALIHLDGTPNKARLGSNAVLAASLAFARALAQERQVPLYIYFASLLGQEGTTLPRLTINLLSGGKHAGRQVAIQDVLIVPVCSTSIDESLVMAYDVYQAAAALVERRYGMRLLTADEGGLAPPCESAEALIQTAVEAIESAGYRPGTDVALALDVAASHFYAEGRLRSGRPDTELEGNDCPGPELGEAVPSGKRGRRAGRKRLGTLAEPARSDRKESSGDGRRPTLHESGTHPTRRRFGIVQYSFT